MKYLKILFFFFLLIGTILILRNHQTVDVAPYLKADGKIFGTQYHILYQSATPLDSAIHQALQEVDSSLSMFNPNSTLARLNSGETNQVDSLFSVVFNLAKEVARETNGAFDPTVAPAVNAWGFGPKRRQQPSQSVLDSIAPLVDYRKVQLQGDTLLSRANERINLDFGAIAKGLGVDHVAAALRQHGVKNFMVEIGGEVVVSGTNAKGELWRIGIQKPTTADTELQEVIHLNNAAMATSGNYRNYYTTSQGQRIAHTIDPRTVRPVSHSLLSATVIAPTCAVADAYATAFMVLGVDSAKVILNNHPELSAYLIYQDADSLCVYANIDLVNKLTRYE